VLLLLSLTVEMRLLTESTESRIVSAGAGWLLTLLLGLRLLGGGFLRLRSVEIVSSWSVEWVLSSLTLGSDRILSLLLLLLQVLRVRSGLLLERNMGRDLLLLSLLRLLLLCWLGLRVAGRRLLTELVHGGWLRCGSGWLLSSRRRDDRRKRSVGLGGSGLFRCRWCVGTITVQTTEAERTELHFHVAKT
jgi:hypothetical protein